MFALLGGKLPRAEVRLHTALALVKIKFAQGQNARGTPDPACRLSGQKLPARTLAPLQNSPEEGWTQCVVRGSGGVTLYVYLS